MYEKYLSNVNNNNHNKLIKLSSVDFLMLDANPYLCTNFNLQQDGTERTRTDKKAVSI